MDAVDSKVTRVSLPRQVLVIAPPGYRSEALGTILKSVRPVLSVSFLEGVRLGLPAAEPNLVILMPDGVRDDLLEQVLMVKMDYPAAPLFVYSEKLAMQAEFRQAGADEVLPPGFPTDHLFQLIDRWLTAAD